MTTSPYASGALVKCRKVGAANWGNKTKKEEIELDTSKTLNSMKSLSRKGYEKWYEDHVYEEIFPNCVKRKKNLYAITPI